MKNNISLLRILGILLVTVSLFFVMVFFSVFENVSMNNQMELLILFSIFSAAFGFLICSVGLLFQKSWSRILALVLNSLIFMGWSLIAYNMVMNIRQTGYTIEDICVIGGFNLFVYTILISAFIFLNNTMVKKELE